MDLQTPFCSRDSCPLSAGVLPELLHLERLFLVRPRSGGLHVHLLLCFLPPPLSSVQFSRSVVSDSLRSHGLQHARPPCPSPTPRVHSNSCSLSQRCHPTISSSCPLLLPPSVFPSIRVFSSESALRIRWPKYWSFSLSICPSNEHPGLISFRMAWLDLLAVQGTLKSLLQHQSSKASILQHLHEGSRV